MLLTSSPFPIEKQCRHILGTFLYRLVCNGCFGYGLSDLFIEILKYDFLCVMLGSIHLLCPSYGISGFQVLINPPCNSDLLCDLQNHLHCLNIDLMQLLIQSIFCQERCLCSPPILLEIVKIQPTIFADGIGCACRQSQIGIIEAVFTFCVSNFHNPFPFEFRFSLVSQAKRHERNMFDGLFVSLL